MCIRDSLEDEQKRLGNLRLDAYNYAKMVDGPDPAPPSEAELEQAEAERKLAYATNGASLLVSYRATGRCSHCGGEAIFPDDTCILCGRLRQQPVPEAPG